LSSTVMTVTPVANAPIARRNCSWVVVMNEVSQLLFQRT
jgi:hypothetical protein